MPWWRPRPSFGFCGIYYSSWAGEVVSACCSELRFSRRAERGYGVSDTGEMDVVGVDQWEEDGVGMEDY